MEGYRMECIKIILNNETFWHFITVISSFIIVMITLSSERKNNRESIEVQRKLQKEQHQINERLHKESLQLEKEQVRANLLPYLKLEQKIKIGQRNGYYVFPLIITNWGNSGAFDVKVEYKVLDNNLIYVYKHKLCDNIDYYQYTGFLSDNVLPVGYSGSFELCLDNFRNGEHFQKNEKVTIGEVHFSILFKDSLYNQYRQNYMFQYDSKDGCGRVESYLPQLIEGNNT